MPDPMLVPGSITLDELAAALEHETRRTMRKRLRALQAVLQGLTPPAAARATDTAPESIRRWIDLAREGGLNGLLHDRRALPRLKPMSPEQTSAMRAEISAVLKRGAPRHLRARLLAIDALLRGQTVEETATTALVKPASVNRWMRRIRRQGIVAFAQSDVRDSHRLDADPALFLAAAAAERHPNIKRRLLALANVADGMPVDAAAAHAGINHSTLRTHIRKFQAHGLEGVQRTGKQSAPVATRSSPMG